MLPIYIMFSKYRDIRGNNIETITLKFQRDTKELLRLSPGGYEYLSFQKIDDVSIGFVAESEGIRSSEDFWYIVTHQ